MIAVPPQNRGVTPSVVKVVTEENIHMVSRLNKGMIQNPDGSFSRTPQYDTWARNNALQLKDNYESTPMLPEELKNIPGHPEPTSLKLECSHEGEWVMIPTSREEEGVEPTNQRVGRVEKYIDLDGTVKRALCYGEDDLKLGIWYHMEEMRLAFPNWNPPEPSKFYNSRKFANQVRRNTSNETAPKSKPKAPRDQSDDIQGKRGQRGRGSNSGAARGRGRPTSRGGGRPTYRGQEWNREYREWDQNQASGSRDHEDRQHWEEDSWRENRDRKDEEDRRDDSHRSQRESQRDPHRRSEQEHPGYYTKEYEERKRARSPTPRRRERERYEKRDRSPSYDQEKGRGRGRRRSYSPDERSRRRYHSHTR